MPYLTHIKSLSDSWASLRYLADFMDGGTTSLRWKFLRRKPKELEERSQRTKVTLLQMSQGQSTKTEFNSPNNLEKGLADFLESIIKEALLRLFVKDLSRQIIELLGSKFDINPMLFRKHIDDYSWYNTRDPWTVAPSLIAAMNHRNWFPIRNVRLRYFASSATFENTTQEASFFNVLRRPDNNHKY
ncbi:hypothetical protein K432DRAFT_442327 [Lepidopterella palustris CBS 459.81]|uniref:Uncharacterized protein n=1 Tax=Lepidopterella palustris CBS 459.81 TaxID=1314670 RepID=A0A8E2ECI8_9PEZI|nr:hypothetical protein K432DRAFT_442327 [Lepidopterella palustris CBS 459.81]